MEREREEQKDKMNRKTMQALKLATSIINSNSILPKPIPNGYLWCHAL